MPYCRTWLIVPACWLLQAPSLGTLPHSISSGLAALFLATTSSCCPSSHNALLLYSVSLLVRVNLPLCFSLLHSVLTCSSSVCPVIYLRWLFTLCPLTVHSLWAPSFFLPPLFFFFFSVPPSHPALDSLSVFCWVWVCDLGIYQKTAVLPFFFSALCIIWISFLSYLDLASWRLKIWMPVLNYHPW